MVFCHVILTLSLTRALIPNTNHNLPLTLTTVFALRPVGLYTGRMCGCQKCTRIYGPYIRPVYTALGTHYPYIRAVQPKSIANNAFLYGPYMRAVYTGDRYALPVHTARRYGPYVRVVCTGVKNAPVYTGDRYTLPV